LFKYFSRLPLILILVLNLIFIAPIFAEDNPNTQLVEKYWSTQAFKEKLAEKFLKCQVVVETGIPKRHGSLDRKQGTATVIEKVIKDQKIIYRFLLTPHEVHSMDYVLQHWKEAGLKIFVLGKNNSKINARIIAWNWFTASLLIEAEVLLEQKENFDFEAVAIADELAGALRKKDGSCGRYERIFSSGFPNRFFAMNSGYVSEYITSESPFRFGDSVAIIPRRMVVMYDYFGGPGQSGGGVFRVIVKVENEKVKIERLELLGLVIGSLAYKEGLLIAVPIDIIVEAFLKDIPQLSLNLPTFKLPVFYTDLATSFPKKIVNQGENEDK